jgi:hypothetical protein
LLSSDLTSETLKAEIKTSIYRLFESENVMVIDFTSIENSPISIPDLIEKIANKNYSFSLSNYESSIVAIDYWTTQYQLTISLNNKRTEEVLYFQKVAFKPIIKSFGASKKEVWTLFLGEITLP